MNDLMFEWDENKNILNQKNDYVSFGDAKTVFVDDLARLIPDPDHSIGEQRFILMGLSAKFNLLTVCHCEKEGNIIRIISARKADKFERKQYEGDKYA